MTNLTEDIQKKFLPFVEKPLRYVGGELNAVRKDLSVATAHGCCCFPDVYDIGMSHHGLQILYHIVNSNENWALSRCFHPWTDAEKVMRETGLPLYTLEYFSPVLEADWIGFSVQYELQYANLVNMIDLAGLPVLSAEREEDHPVIIAGGPCVNNPEPLTPFVDAFLIGDGEEAVVEFCEVVEKFKGAGRGRILEEVARIGGFYVPSRYTYDNAGIFAVPDIAGGERVKPARIGSFDARHIPKNPVVPLMEVVHHRMAAEVMRGCTRGCRFCSAGTYYRPVREKDIGDIREQIEEGVRRTGWREVGLLSLSTADYSQITGLLASMRSVKRDFHLRMTLPSTRIDALTVEQLDELNAVAPITSFTIAPEAGSLRLRKVINKDFTDEAIYDTVRLLLDRNAQTIKLYFMTGLPTEREEDIQAIIDMVRTISSTMRSRSPRLSLHVSLSPFSPKANTPFQWEGMESTEAVGEKGRFIKKCLSDRKNVKVSYRDGKMAFLETVMARGDRRVGDVILEAWKAGARLDGWDERFDINRWIEAAKTAGVDLDTYTKAIDIDEKLPWSAVSVGIDIDFLKRERERAFEGEATGDCRGGECLRCGACGGEVSMRFAEDAGVSCGQTQSINLLTPSINLLTTSKDLLTASTNILTPPSPSSADSAMVFGRRKQAAASGKTAVGNRYRLTFEKRESLRFLGHLDMVAVFHRAMIAAGFPLAFSQGFNPHPRVSFGPPLPLGAIGLNESFDIETKFPLTGDPLDVNKWLPDGLRVKSCVINRDKSSLSAAIIAARYLIYPPGDISPEMMSETLERIINMPEIIVKREKDGRVTEKNIRPAILRASVKDGNIETPVKYCAMSPPELHAGVMFRRRHDATFNWRMNNSDNGGGGPYWEAVLSLSQGGAVSCKPSEFISVLCPDRPAGEFLICRAECVTSAPA